MGEGSWAKPVEGEGREMREERRASVSRAMSALKRSFLISCHHFNGLSHGLIWGMRVNCHYLFKPKSIPASGTILGFFFKTFFLLIYGMQKICQNFRDIWALFFGDFFYRKFSYLFDNMTVNITSTLIQWPELWMKNLTVKTFLNCKPKLNLRNDPMVRR